jgi:hypothetical protein
MPVSLTYEESARFFTDASIARTPPSIFARTISQNPDCIGLLPHLSDAASLIDAEV